MILRWACHAKRYCPWHVIGDKELVFQLSATFGLMTVQVAADHSLVVIDRQVLTSNLVCLKDHE